MKPQLMRKKPVMRTAPTTPQLMTQSPTTLDDYLSYVQDRMQLEAMKVKQSGIADLRLTIAKDGTIQRAEVVRVEGPAALRDQATSMVNQVGKLPPLPPDANAEVLVVDTTVAFNYPSGELYDRIGRR
jgi:TonB family protein